MVSTARKILPRTGEDDHRGGGRIAPDQYFDAGYRDGMNQRRNYRLYGSNAHYTKGYIQGERHNPAASVYNPTGKQLYWTEEFQLSTQYN